MNTQFKEEQKFTQWWLWIILAGIAIVPIYGVYKQLILGKSFGSKPMSDTGLIITTVIIVVVIAMFLLLRLHTEIDKFEIRMRFFPFIKKRFRWEEIKSAEVLDYGFVGGWGIRLWTAYGTVYNVKGTKGIAIELLNGKKFLIGTQKETELREILEKINT